MLLKKIPTIIALDELQNNRILITKIRPALVRILQNLRHKSTVTYTQKKVSIPRTVKYRSASKNNGTGPGVLGRAACGPVMINNNPTVCYLCIRIRTHTNT